MNRLCITALLAAFVWQHQHLKRVMPLLPFVALLLSTRSFPAYFAYALPALAVAGTAVGTVVGVAGFHHVVSGYRRSSDYLGHSGSAGKLVDVLHHQWTTLHLWNQLPVGKVGVHRGAMMAAVGRPT